MLYDELLLGGVVSEEKGVVRLCANARRFCIHDLSHERESTKSAKHHVQRRHQFLLSASLSEENLHTTSIANGLKMMRKMLKDDSRTKNDPPTKREVEENFNTTISRRRAGHTKILM